MRRFKILYVIVMILFLLPFVALITESLRPDTWFYVYTDVKTYRAIATTIIVAVATLVLNIAIGTPAASVLARREFRGKRLVELIILLPLIIPSFVTSMGIYFTFIKLGLSETMLGVLVELFVHIIYHI